jgi:guanylate kinase
MTSATAYYATILYGPPASGKSTITEHLEKLDQRFRLFSRLKAGAGRHGEYRITTAEQIDKLCASGDVIWTNERFGSVYAIDRPYLHGMITGGLIPILHAGQIAAVDAIFSALPDAQVTRVSLTCPRRVAEQRINARATGDSAERLAAYDATLPLPDADLVVDTSMVDPTESAAMIIKRMFR